MTQAQTKTEAQLDQAMHRYAGDPQRVEALSRAKVFKRSWIDLAETLSRVRDDQAFRRWGFASFEEYCGKELHLKPATIEKLCASYRFLRSNAPRLLREEDNADDVRPVPTWQAVDFVLRAEERGAADDDTLDEMKRAVFEEGVPAPALSRRFREVAFPLGADEKRGRARQLVAQAARRVADLVADPQSGVPRVLAEKVEGIMGELITCMVD